MSIIFVIRTVFVLLLATVFNQATAQTSSSPNYKNCKQCIVLCEQSIHRIVILDLPKKSFIWEWQPSKAQDIKPEHVDWFKHPSDAKSVQGGKAILMTASGGAVALVRIADKKVLFYGYAGGNTHSAELLPDGNIVSASSTGNFMTVLHTNARHFPDSVYSRQIPLPFGHNAVWDKKRKVLWCASMKQLKTFTYNFNRTQPDLIIKDSVALPGNEAHDLFPVYGEQALWLTNTTATYQYHINKKQLSPVSLPYPHVKSVSSAPKPQPSIFTHPNDAKGSWWTEEIYSTDGKVIYKQAGLKIYKARWFVENSFSY